MDISKLLVSDIAIVTGKSPIGLCKKLKSHPCSWTGCKKVFGRTSDASRHYRIHTNDRPFQCPLEYCAKRFTQKSALTVHSRTHSGERPYICQFLRCNKSFKDSSSLARHRRIHSQKRIHACTEIDCTRSYIKKSHLNRHIKRVHDKDNNQLLVNKDLLLPSNEFSLPHLHSSTNSVTDEDEVMEQQSNYSWALIHDSSYKMRSSPLCLLPNTIT